MNFWILQNFLKVLSIEYHNSFMDSLKILIQYHKTIMDCKSLYWIHQNIFNGFL